MGWVWVGWDQCVGERFVRGLDRWVSGRDQWVGGGCGCGWDQWVGDLFGVDRISRWVDGLCVGGISGWVFECVGHGSDRSVGEISGWVDAVGLDKISGWLNGLRVDGISECGRVLIQNKNHFKRANPSWRQTKDNCIPF